MPGSIFSGEHVFSRSSLIGAGLIALFLLLNFWSIILVSSIFTNHVSPITAGDVLAAIPFIAPLFLLLPLFLMARFSFGYLVGLNMYGMVAGFILLSYSTQLNYNHSEARFSALASLIVFLVPVLFLRLPIRSPLELTRRQMGILLIALLILTSAVLLWNTIYGYRLGGFFYAMNMRDDIPRPTVLNYINANWAGAILPFAFAYYALQKRWMISSICALLCFAFFPFLLNKIVLFTPIWLVFLLILFRFFSPKVATVFSLIIPVSAGIVFYYLSFMGIAFDTTINLFLIVGLRMFATPSGALDHYFAFFSNHPLTGFCQISILGRFMNCPYSEQLGVLLEREYHLGNFNGSLFVTEGIASLGPVFAPIGTFICGIIIAVASSISARVTPALVAVSSGVVVQHLMNVPLSTTLLSNGAATLFLLWYIAPPQINSEPVGPAEEGPGVA